MKQKLILSTILVLLFAFSIVSAASFSASGSLNFVRPESSKTFTLNPGNATNFIIVTPTINDVKGNAIPISVSGQLLNINTPQTINLSTSLDYANLEIGKTYSGNLIIRNSDNLTDSLTLPVTFLSSFCKYGEAGSDLEISNIDITNTDGDETEWIPMDRISVEVEVSNEGNDKIRDIVVELGLYNSDGKNIVKELENLDNKQIDVGSLDDGDSETVTFTFSVPTDFDAETYKLVLKTFSEDDGEKEVCTSWSSDLDDKYFQEIEGQREDDEENMIIVSDIKLSPSPAQCGEKIQVNAEVVNIGEEDFEDQIKVTLYNKELNLNLEQEIKEDFNQGDSSSVDFDFDIPKTAKEKTYTFELRTYYEYNKRTDDYELVSEKKFTQTLKVEGACEEESRLNAQISAELGENTPEPKAGKDVSIKSTLKNTGNKKTTYTLSVQGNSAWSSLSSIEPSVVTLNPGETKDLEIILNLDDDAEGEKEFSIKASYENKTTEQRVAFAITPTSSVDTEVISNHLKQNWFIYVIILVNVLLLIAIILVVRKILTPKRRVHD